MTVIEETKTKTWDERLTEQRDEISKNLKEKNYIITAYRVGDISMSGVAPKNMCFPQKFYDVVSLEEIPSYSSGCKHLSGFMTPLQRVRS